LLTQDERLLRLFEATAAIVRDDDNDWLIDERRLDLQARLPEPDCQR